LGGILWRTKNIYLLPVIFLHHSWLVRILPCRRKVFSETRVPIQHSQIHVTVSRMETGLILVVHREQRLCLIHGQVNSLSFEDTNVFAHGCLTIVGRGYPDLTAGTMREPLVLLGRV